MKRKIIVTLIAGLALLILICLGLWQCSRAHEKEAMISQRAHYDKMLPHPWSASQSLPAQYEPVEIKGRFLSTVFLLDNQYSQHQWGYHVLSPFRLLSGALVIIDRGWVKGDITRRLLPDIKIVHKKISIQGHVYYPSVKQFVLSDITEQPKPNVYVTESLKIAELARQWHRSLLPFVVRLDKPNALGYVRDWPTVALTPARHYAYAWQWFGLALLTLIYWGYDVSKKT
jgi:surfeit locus 1 family protein